MNDIKKYIVLLFFVFAYFTTTAQINKTHKKLLNIALQNNHSIKQSILELEQQEQHIKEIQASGLPEININASTNMYFDMPTVIIPGDLFGMPADMEGNLGKPYNLDAGISFSQILFNKKYNQGLKTAQSSVELYKLLKIKSEEDVVYQVSYAYYMYLASLESLQILEQNLQITTSNKKIAQNLVGNGMALPIDIKRIEVRETELGNQMNLLKSSINEQELRVKLLLGVDDVEINANNDSILFIKENNTIKNTDSIARTELQLLEHQKKVSELKIESEKAAYYPTLTFFGSYAYNAQRDEFNYFSANENWNTISLIGLKLSIPVFSGGKKKSRVKQAKIEKNITESKLVYAKQNYEQEKLVVISNYESVRKNTESLHENVLRTEEVYKVVLLKYKEGILPLTELFVAESELSSSKLNYTKSLLDLYVADLNVARATGQLKLLVEN